MALKIFQEQEPSMENDTAIEAIEFVSTNPVLEAVNII